MNLINYHVLKSLVEVGPLKYITIHILSSYSTYQAIFALKIIASTKQFLADLLNLFTSEGCAIFEATFHGAKFPAHQLN